jgi:hypothetical protein
MTNVVKGALRRLTPGQIINPLVRFDELIICKSLEN